jgi:glycosyltransferase involved in cell wall biosynthesis
MLDRAQCALFIKTTNPIVRSRDPWLIAVVRRLVYARLFRMSSAVLTLSDAETRLLRTQFPGAADKFETIHNAYMSKEFEALPIARQARDPHAPANILAVGRLVAQKNFARLLRAFALVGDPGARLSIAGDGEERRELEALAAQLGISDRVEFLGYRHDVPALMAAADLFVLSSDYEGLPAVVVEALACDCPVIATNCFANAADLLEGLPGCHVTGHSVEELAAAIRHWLEKPVFDATLRPHALRYTTASAVRSHLEAMKHRTDNDHRRPEISDDLARPAVPAGA